MSIVTDKQKAIIDQAAIDQAAKNENQTLGFMPSMMHDLFLWIEHEAFDEFVLKVVLEIETTEAKRNKRSSEVSEKLRFAVKSLLLNLLRVERCSHKTELAFKKAADDYTLKSRYSQKLASYKSMMAAYDGLLRLRYFHVVTNGYLNREINKGKVTRIEPTLKLKTELWKIFPQQLVFFTRHPNEETIFLRAEKVNGKKISLDYEDTSFTRIARDNLAIINKRLNKHWYDLDISNEEFSALDSRIIDRHQKDPNKLHAVDFSSRSLYRVFNDGDFKKGGRFYGGWWEGVPSEYRQHITIDGKITVEVDYANLHPFMLYAKVGQTFPGDAYEIEGVHDRGMIKLAFVKLLNGGQRLAKPDGYDDAKVGMSWEQLLKAIEDKHKPISEYFRTGYGIDLMNNDSAIAERVMLAFDKRGYPCLPVHDSFIVHHALENELKDIMMEEYKSEFGTDAINLKVEGGLREWLQSKSKVGTVWIDDDIGDILKETEERQYLQRLSQWYAYCSIRRE